MEDVNSGRSATEKASVEAVIDVALALGIRAVVVDISGRLRLL